MSDILERIRAKKAAWDEAFLNASEEERKRMLEERKREEAENERLRQQRIYDNRKAEFFEKCDKEIACQESLKKAVKTAVEVAKTFDGKVLNNRLTKAIQEKLGKNISAVLEISYDYNLENNRGKLTIREGNFYGCNNEEFFYINLSPFSDGNRVMWKETEKSLKFSYDNRLAEAKNAKKTYDKVYKKLMDVEKAINEYSKCNFMARNFLKAKSVLRGAYYL